MRKGNLHVMAYKKKVWRVTTSTQDYDLFIERRVIITAMSLFM